MTHHSKDHVPSPSPIHPTPLFWG